MKICTLTCHDVYNHGASLQAYALMKYITSCGHNVEIINYKPDYLSNHYNLFSINNPKWEKNLFSKLIYLGIKIPNRIIGLKRKKAFDKFTIKYLHLTEQLYKTKEQLQKQPPIADAYICGSDQIWNCFSKTGKDTSFYLDFVSNKIKASYAASFATNTLPEEYRDFVKDNVNKLDFIGVREKSGVKILNDLNIKRAVNVVDPVFLLDRSEWDRIGENHVFNEIYILIYDFDNSELIKKLAKDIKNRLGYKIYSISQNKIDYCDKVFNLSGPETYVSLIRNAQFIISNSFHAAVFSIIYEKEFVIVNRNEAINTRMKDLLEDLYLSDRMIEKNYNINNLLKPISYKKSKVRLIENITKSKEFLNLILRKGKGVDNYYEENSNCNRLVK